MENKSVFCIVNIVECVMRPWMRFKDKVNNWPNNPFLLAILALVLLLRAAGCESNRKNVSCMSPRFGNLRLVFDANTYEMNVFPIYVYSHPDHRTLPPQPDKPIAPVLKVRTRSWRQGAEHFPRVSRRHSFNVEIVLCRDWSTIFAGGDRI